MLDEYCWIDIDGMIAIIVIYYRDPPKSHLYLRAML